MAKHSTERKLTPIEGGKVGGNIRSSWTNMFVPNDIYGFYRESESVADLTGTDIVDLSDTVFTRELIGSGSLSYTYENATTNQALLSEIAELRAQIGHLTDAVSELSARLASQETSSTRDVTMEQAKEEIANLLRSVDQMYPSEIAQTLSLDVELVLDALQSLETKDKSVGRVG